MVRSRTAAGRRLAAVLFTDVVGSTTLAARLGDDAWAGCSSGTTGWSAAS